LQPFIFFPDYEIEKYRGLRYAAQGSFFLKAELVERKSQAKDVLKRADSRLTIFMDLKFWI
jgi:hypothetical protein